MYIFKGSEGGLDKSLITNVIPKFSTEGLVRKMEKCLYDYYWIKWRRSLYTYCKGIFLRFSFVIPVKKINSHHRQLFHSAWVKQLQFHCWPINLKYQFIEVIKMFLNWIKIGLKDALNYRCLRHEGLDSYKKSDQAKTKMFSQKKRLIWVDLSIIHFGPE